MLAKARESVRNYRERFFRDEAEERDAEVLALAREIIEWAGMPYHDKFMNWLDEESAKPINVQAAQINIVESAVRANTFKEVRQHLSKLHANAGAAVSRAEGDRK